MASDPGGGVFIKAIELIAGYGFACEGQQKGICKTQIDRVMQCQDIPELSELSIFDSIRLGTAMVWQWIIELHSHDTVLLNLFYVLLL